MPASRIVAAVGAATAKSRNPQAAKRIEQAMSAAVMAALAEGIDPHDPRIRERMLAARDAIKAKHL